MSPLARPGLHGFLRASVPVVVWLCLVIGCASTTVRHHPLATPSPWVDGTCVGRHYQTEHFDLYSTVTDAAFESALPAFLEDAYAAYTAFLPESSDAPDRLQTFILATRAEWGRYVRRRFPTRSRVYERILSGGFTEGTVSVSAFSTRSAALAILAHEGWHQYVHGQMGSAMPAWLNEGSACCFESVDAAGHQVRFRPKVNPHRANALREAVRPEQRLSLRELVSTNPAAILTQSDPGALNRYYAQAWALVTFLRYGEGGKHARALRTMLSDLADGTYQARARTVRLTSGDNATADEVLMFEVYFGVAPDEMESAYFDYVIRQCRY